MSSIFDMIQNFTQVFQWISNSFYNVIKNISVYADQIFTVVNLLPAEVKGIVIASLSITFVYFILRLF